ncbi:MAG: hypothetical protein ACRDN8_04840 [Thermoleophilaceae bacterium]
MTAPNAHGLAARLRSRHEDLLAKVDQRLLRVCPTCEEIAYPGADERTAARPAGVARSCHFCGRGGLERLGEGAESAIERERATM